MTWMWFLADDGCEMVMMGVSMDQNGPRNIGQFQILKMTTKDWMPRQMQSASIRFAPSRLQHPLPVQGSTVPPRIVLIA